MRRFGNTARDPHQHFISGLMSEHVIVGLEMIGIDHQQREGLLPLPRMLPLLGYELIELAAIPKPRQRVGRRQFFELVLGPLAPFDFACEHKRCAGNKRDQRQHDPADAKRLLAPERKDIVPGFRNHHNDRTAVISPDKKPLDLVECAQTGKRSALLCEHLPDTGFVTQIPADVFDIEWGTHDHHAVTPENRDDVVRQEREPPQQIMEITQMQRAGDNALKRTILTGDPAAQHHRIRAMMNIRKADEEADIGLLLMDPEILLGGTVLGFRIKRRGIVSKIAAGVEHLDRPEVFCRRGVVEQNKIENALADAFEVRFDDVIYDIAQRQIIELDVAADIGIDGCGEVLHGLESQRLLAAPHVQHDAAADSRKSRNGRERTPYQQSC